MKLQPLHAENGAAGLDQAGASFQPFGHVPRGPGHCDIRFQVQALRARGADMNVGDGDLALQRLEEGRLLVDRLHERHVEVGTRQGENGARKTRAAPDVDESPCGCGNVEEDRQRVDEVLLDDGLGVTDGRQVDPAVPEDEDIEVTAERRHD